VDDPRLVELWHVAESRDEVANTRIVVSSQESSSPPRTKEPPIQKSKVSTFTALPGAGPKRPATRRASRKPAAPTTTGPASRLPNPVLKVVETSLDADKAEEIVTIDLTNKTSIADYMVIATGRSQRQLVAMADHLAMKLKPHGISPIPIEGKDHGDWVLIDAGDVVVHLFRPEARAHYNLEKMWAMDMPEPERAAAGA
jgi:ribosome-associated protein